MGKGDRKTKRGKIWRGTHGKARSKKNNSQREHDGKDKS
ncbi:MAG: 30S ribosomal protein THX [Desulfosalsimonas sp.]